MTDNSPRDDAGKACAIMGLVIAALIVIAIAVGTMIGGAPL